MSPAARDHGELFAAGEQLTSGFAAEPVDGTIVVDSVGRGWQRHDQWRRTPPTFRWWPTYSYLRANSSESDYSRAPLAWRELLALTGTVTVLWRPEDE